MTDTTTQIAERTATQTTSYKMIDWALFYAAIGWQVFPCDALKHPRIKAWQLNATTDQDTIRAWWYKWPGANIGTACGLSGFVVVDVDVKKGAPGLVNWLAILDQHGGELADTLSQHTPSGGLQYLYRECGHEVRNTTSKLAVGVDIRGDGGLILLPPSKTAVGGYSWDMNPDTAIIADFPQVLFDLLPAKTVQVQTPTARTQPINGNILGGAYWLKKACNAATVGNRHDQGLKLADQLRAATLTVDEAAAYMLDFAEYCEQLGPCDESAQGHMSKILVDVYEWPDYTKQPVYITALPDEPPIDELDGFIDSPMPSATTEQPSQEPASFTDIDYLKMHACTQLGNAERLIRLHGQNLRYCEQLGGWLCWDGQRWKVDDTGAVELLAKSMSQVIYAEVLQTPDKTQQGKLAMCAMKAESLQFVKGTLALAWSEPGIPTTPDVWDSNGWLLNVRNGTLDLRTGVLLPHCQVDLITKLAPVSYDPDASDPVLDRYLADVTRGDPDLLAYLQRAAGYSLTGDTREEVFFLMLGKGGGGKSTFVEMMLAMLGDYGIKAGFDTFLEGKTTPGAARSDLMAFRGARFVGATETAKTRRLAESMVKELTGGDTVSARELHHKQMTFAPTFKVWLAANFAPEMSDDDTGIWRRLKEVPFDMVLPPDKVDEGLKIHLKTDPGARAALLNWLLDGCLQWQAGKLGKCPIVERATSELRASFDPLVTFLDTCCTVSPYAQVEAKSLRAAYDAWRVSEGVKEGINDKEWSQRLKAKGCHSGRGRHNGTQATLWYGIGLQSEQSEVLPF